MTFDEMKARIAEGQGFIAALDQSGGSTPKALAGYGVAEDAWTTEDEMFGLIHEMRQRIIESPCFGNGKVIGAILFEKTMEGASGGKSVPARLKERGIVPFLKVDKGLAEERDGAQLMKPNPGLEDMCNRARELGVFGTKMRSVIKSANPVGIKEAVRQQFAEGARILSCGLVPMLEPEYDITAADRAEAKAGELYANGSWDLVDASTQEGFDLAAIPDDALPEAMREMTLEEKQQHIAAMAQQRAALQQQIQQLAAHRSQHVAAERARLAEEEGDDLGTVFLESVDDQLEQSGFETEDAPQEDAG